MSHPFRRRAVRNIAVAARYDLANDGYEVALRIDGEAVTGLTLKPITGEQREPLFASDEGTAFLQEALECAWRVGLRPHGFKELVGEMAATSKHLEDMRAIAFHVTKAEKP